MVVSHQMQSKQIDLALRRVSAAWAAVPALHRETPSKRQAARVMTRRLPGAAHCRH
jgi:hypothetical protein